MREYLQETVLPYVSNYYRKVIRVHSQRKVDLTIEDTFCITQDIPKSQRKVHHDADMVLLVTTMDQASNTIAAAGFCKVCKSNKRPIVGEVLLNVDTFNRFDPDSDMTFQFMTVTLLHEIMHAMGFSKRSFGYYQDPLKKTADKRIGRDKVVKRVQKRGKEVSLVILPKVVATVREYYGCASMEGMELEDEGGSGTAGSHWEKRLIEGELMLGSIGSNQGISVITMAMLESMGWYRIRSPLYAHNVHFGRHMGCDFINRPCYSRGTVLSDQWCHQMGDRFQAT